MAKLFANSGDPDQMPHSAASDLGLHYSPITLLRVSRLQWVKQNFTFYKNSFFRENIHFPVKVHYCLNLTILVQQ